MHSSLTSTVLNLESCSLQTDNKKPHKKMTTATSHLRQPFRLQILTQIDYLNRISQLNTELSTLQVKTGDKLLLFKTTNTL